MRYAVKFMVITAACFLVAWVYWDSVGWLAALPLYAGLSFTFLAAAYSGGGARMLLKRPNGRRSPLAWIPLAPYFLLTELSFDVHRLSSREPPFVQAAPNVYFGRRLSARESEAAGWTHVLDLAGEFSAARTPTGYRSLPVLDATAPTEDELRSVVEWVAAAAASGPVYVHCALGHGRSACVVVAYLLSIQAAETVEEAERKLRSLRPGVRLNAAQRLVAQRFERSH